MQSDRQQSKQVKGQQIDFHILSVDDLYSKLKVLRTQKKLEFSMFDLYRTIFCPCRQKHYNKALKRKQRLYYSCEGDVNEYLNIELLIKRLKEIEYIKYILLNKDQILSFEYFEKPEISANESLLGKSRHSLIANQQITMPSEEKLEKIICYFKQANSLDVGSTKEKEMNKKIFNLLKEDLKIFIQAN